MRIFPIGTSLFAISKLSRYTHSVVIGFASSSLFMTSFTSSMEGEKSSSSSLTEDIIDKTLNVESITTTIPSLSDSKQIPWKRPENGLFIYWHPDCYEHNIPDHPEQPDRVKFILEKLKNKYGNEYFKESPLALIEHLQLFHQPQLVERFHRLTAAVEEAHSLNKYGYKRIDDDTVVMWKTREAALRAVGAVIQAIDDIYSTPFEMGKIKTAFCCVRPPGHHAERHRSMGFCFFNNVGIGAKYAQSKYGVGKVAIIDFDVHHGNGSEEGLKDFETMFFGSTHEKDNYPGTGQDPTPYIGEKVQNPIHRRIVNRYLSSGKQSRIDFKKKWKEIVDEMILFKPELIIISAGFDAHDQDPLSGTKLVEEDFEWATKIVIQASKTINHSNPPPIVSSLEGGYNLHYLAKSAFAHVNVLAESNTISVEPEHYSGDEVAELASHIKSLGLDS